MNISTLREALGAETALIRLRRQGLWLLGLAHLMTLGYLLWAPTPIILVPPTLDQAVTLTREQGSGALKESWGLYVAELLGNITPANALFIERSLGPLLASGVYREVMASVHQDLAALRADRVSIRFRALEVLHDPEQDRVFVRGETITQGPASPPQSEQRTYQIDLRFHHYRPVIEGLEVYPGGPRGLDQGPTPREP
jgi:conjugal transfer pilus assembly protein TraE